VTLTHLLTLQGISSTLQQKRKKELAKQVTTTSSIDKSIVSTIKEDPARAFIELEAVLILTDQRLWTKALVNNLKAGTLLPEKISTTISLHPGDQIKQYEALKLLLFKTYTSVDAPAQARESLLKVRMNPVLGPRALYTMLISARKICMRTARTGDGGDDDDGLATPRQAGENLWR